MKNMKKAIVVALWILLLSGCAVPPEFDTVIKDELQVFASQIEEELAFDPFANTVHTGDFSQDDLDGLYEAYLKRCDQKISAGHIKPDSVENLRPNWTYAPETLENRLRQMGVVERFVPNAAAHLYQRGWVVTQRKFAKEGATHGVYSVPSILVVQVGWKRGEFGLAQRTPSVLMLVTGKTAAAKQAEASAPSPAKHAPAPAEAAAAGKPKFCGECGASYAGAVKFCSECGTKR
jgi:hypothetical protein